MHYSIRLNTTINVSQTAFDQKIYAIRVMGVESLESISIEKLLNFLLFCREEIFEEEVSNWLVHPLPSDVESLKKSSSMNKFYYFEPVVKLNKLLATHGTLLQQIEYLNLMGITDAIDRRDDLRTASNYYKFNSCLAKYGLSNPSLSINPIDNSFNEPIRRIHAVHPSFLKDPEIRAGLYISQQKNTAIDKVLYVCSPETLALAIQYCAPSTTLIIDGHWEHGKISTHGVWEVASAVDIASKLSELLTQNPGKINSIRLLGCEAGYLSSFEELPQEVKSGSFVFKDDASPLFFKKEMAKFRNRAVYYSEHGESPFAKNSLAGEIISRTEQIPIKISACSSRTYPFPAEQIGKFNIGSDNSEWKGEHFWKTPDETLPFWYSKLHQLKSITFIKIKCTDKVCAPIWAI